MAMTVARGHVSRAARWLFAFALVGCTRAGDDTDARLAAARPQLGPAAQWATELLRGARRCESPLPSFPGCEHNHGQVLLLAEDVEGGAGRRVAALLFVPAGREMKRTMTMWHVDSVGAPLGGGWYPVTAVSHVD